MSFSLRRLASFLCIACLASPLLAQERPIAVKVAIIAMFEAGEDTGTLQSLEFLSAAHRVDLNRVLILRTISNYDQQPRELSATESLAKQRIGAYAAYLPALESAYRVGHTVADELLTHWEKYAASTPGGAANQ